jgi:hypothetical protein
VQVALPFLYCLPVNEMYIDIPQWAASYGIIVLPYSKLQNSITNIDLRAAIRDNVAFKLSFGTTFAAAAFMHL